MISFIKNEYYYIIFLNNSQMYIYIILVIMNIFISAICIINIIKNKKDQEQLLLIIRKKETIIKDIEKQYYSSKLSTIRQNIINALKMQLDDKNKIIDDLKIKNNEINKCSICFNNPISYCCTPCGHTYCYVCINKTNNCYICRGIIQNKLKLYF